MRKRAEERERLTAFLSGLSERAHGKPETELAAVRETQ